MKNLLLPFLFALCITASSPAQNVKKYFANDTLYSMWKLNKDYFELRFLPGGYITSATGYDFLSSVAMMYAGKAKIENKMYPYDKKIDKDGKAMKLACKDADEDSDRVITNQEAIGLYMNVITDVKKPGTDTSKTK